MQVQTKTQTSLRWSDVRRFIVENKPAIGRTVSITSPNTQEGHVTVRGKTSYATPDVASFDAYITNQEEPPRSILQLDLHKGLGTSTLKFIVPRGLGNHNEQGFGEYTFSRFDPTEINLGQSENGVFSAGANYVGTNESEPPQNAAFSRAINDAFGSGTISSSCDLPGLNDSFYLASLAALEKLINNK